MVWRMWSQLALLSASLCLDPAHSFCTRLPQSTYPASHASRLFLADDRHDNLCLDNDYDTRRSYDSRRDFLRNRIVYPLIALSSVSLSDAAAAYPQEVADKEKIVKGYRRLEYLLDNWEKETTFCKNNDNPYVGCDRSPEKVMDYLGYKSMEDPLFRADKTLKRLQSLVTGSSEEDQDDFQDAMEVFIEKAEEGNGYAFISSWGEANPGGGKDRVALFIERSKGDVIEAKKSLGTVMRILKL